MTHNLGLAGWHPHALLGARFIGIVAPTLYFGMTLDCSTVFVQPLVEHAPTPAVLLKQWLRGYQMGPIWVPLTVVPGTIANVLLAGRAQPGGLFHQRGAAWSLISLAHLGAAALLFAIAPLTFLYMEPGINGALKWKAQCVLGESEGFALPPTSIWLPSAWHHGATPASRRRAEQTDAKDLVREWQRVNNVRWAMGAVAALLSGWATLVQL